MKFAKSLLVVTLLGVFAACESPKKTESVSETPPQSTADTIVMVIDKAELRKLALAGLAESKAKADSIHEMEYANDTLPQAYSDQWFCEDTYEYRHTDYESAGLIGDGTPLENGSWGIRSPLWVGTAVKISSSIEKDEYFVIVTNITSQEKRQIRFFVPTEQCIQQRLVGGAGGFIDHYLPNSVSELIGWNGQGHRLGDGFLIQSRNQITSISALGGGPNMQ